MAEWNAEENRLTVERDERVLINVEGVGTFIQVICAKEYGGDQHLAIYEYLNEEVIYENTIPAE